jgi:site-specific recombinase XerD
LKRHKAKQGEDKLKYGEVYQDQDLIFASPLGDPIDPNVFYHNFCRKLKKAKLEHVSFHSLRHSVATLLLEEGVNLKIVSELLGHASVGVTGDIYSFVTQDTKKGTANLLESIIGSSLAVEIKKQEIQ